MWRVVVCDLETSRMTRPWPALGRSATGNKKYMLCSGNKLHVLFYVDQLSKQVMEQHLRQKKSQSLNNVNKLLQN